MRIATPRGSPSGTQPPAPVREAFDIRVDHELGVAPGDGPVEDLQGVARPSADQQAGRGDRDDLAPALTDSTRLEDLTVTLLGAYGVEPTEGMVGRPLMTSN